MTSTTGTYPRRCSSARPAFCCAVPAPRPVVVRAVRADPPASGARRPRDGAPIAAFPSLAAFATPLAALVGLAVGTGRYGYETSPVDGSAAAADPGLPRHAQRASRARVHRGLRHRPLLFDPTAWATTANYTYNPAHGLGAVWFNLVHIRAPLLAQVLVLAVPLVLTPLAVRSVVALTLSRLRSARSCSPPRLSPLAAHWRGH